jgi:hypothetical protein
MPMNDAARRSQDEQRLAEWNAGAPLRVPQPALTIDDAEIVMLRAEVKRLRAWLKEALGLTDVELNDGLDVREAKEKDT